MTVYGTDAIDHAIASAGGGHARLTIQRGDIVTPLARDHAVENGVEIIVEGAPGPARTSAPTQRAALVTPASFAPPPISGFSPSPALYRRGAPLADRFLPRSRRPSARTSAADIRDGSPSCRAARVVVVGAGRVGMITAMRLAETDLIDEVVLVDVADGLAKGTALDISHSSGLLGFTTTLRGELTVEAAGPACYTVITAGKARQPGMSRADLAGTNAAIVGGIAISVAATSPDGVIVVVTNPLDEMTDHVWRLSGLPSSRVVGMAGMLDTARFASLLARTGIAEPAEIGGLALGSHGDEMVVPRSLITANGTAITGRLDSVVLDAIIARTRDSGAEVVELLKTGSAFITPGLSAAQMVISMIRDDDRVVSATVRPSGEYGIDGTYVGLPVRLGRRGLASIVDLDLTVEERGAVVAAATRIGERVRTVAGSSVPS